MRLRRRYLLLVPAVGTYFTTLFARLVLSPVVPDIIAAFDSSKTAVGLAFTGMWAAYALVQYPAGALADRHGERLLVLASIVATGAASLLVAGAPVYPLFLLATALLGASAGVYAPAGTSLLAKRFASRGFALSLHVAGANVAGLVAPVAAAYVAVRYGWRAAPILTLGLVVPLFFLSVVLIRPTTPAEPGATLRSRLSPGAAVSVLSRPSIAFTAAVGTVGVFTFNAVASFLTTFLIEFRGLSTTAAGAAFGVVYLLSATTMPLMGRAADRFDRDHAIAASFCAVATGLALLVLGRGVVPALAAVVVLGAGISWGGSVQSRYMDHLSDAERGTGFGLVRSVTGLAGSVGSVVVGAVSEHSGWPAAYGLVIGLLLVVVVGMALNRSVGRGW